MRLYLLSGGIIDADRSVIFPGDDSGRRVTLPVTQVLIESAGRRVLVDTGMPVEAAGDSEGLKRAFDIDPAWIRPLMRPENRIDEQLRSLGLAIADLDLVVNTHFHFDHAGANALFAGVTIAAQEAEIVAARERGDAMPWWDAPGLQFRSVQGDWSPVAGVEMLHTPGHTPGHQSMIVRLAEEPWLFTWDAVYTEEHWREHKLGVVGDVAAARASIERLREIAERERARVIFGHDAAQWAALGMAEPGAAPRLVAE